MKDLIEALTIFAKYSNDTNPTVCDHDVLIVVGVGYTQPTEEERTRLNELGFRWMKQYDGWASYRFGSA